jgi:predicted esterase
MTAIGIMGMAVVVFGASAGLAAEVLESTPPATRPKPAAKQAWARKLANLKENDWRTAFQTGLQLASLPPEEGFAILKENWEKIGPPDARQQMLKAWYFTLPYPLHPRNHPRLAEVLELGLHDKSLEVRQWAEEFSAKAKGDSSPADAADVADVPAKDLRIGGDANKRYFLIGAAEGAKAPAAGYGLLIVLPGGDGSADFHPFVRRIYKNVLGKDWLIAQPVAPKWDQKQAEKVVWPTEKLRYTAAKFTTEEFIEAVLADVRSKVKIDPRRVFLLGWSSGGPPCYAAALRKGTSVTGAFIAMSVFKPEQVSTLDSAKGKAFYLLQSPDDKVTPMRFAEAAAKALATAGARVKLQQYAGGHGWHGDVFGMIGAGIKWLDKQVRANPPAAAMSSH